MNSGRAGWAERLSLLLLFLLSLGLRIYRIGQPSLSEDEAAKWDAILQYKKGHFAGVNVSHPMVMKMMAWGSFTIGKHVNRWLVAFGAHAFAVEAWLRLPIVLFGAATSVVLYLLARQMLGRLGAWVAAVLWAVTPLSVSLDSVLKEEALFVFFSLLAFYCYGRAKRAPTEAECKRWFTLAGVAFGLDMASYYLGITQFAVIILVWHVANKANIPSRQMGPYFRRLVVVMGLVFVLFNPVILSPKNLEDMLHYTEQKTIQHYGYLMNGHIYLNNFLTTPYGLPWYFYLWVLGTKTPLPVLAAALAGIWLLFRERNTLISIFLRVSLTLWFVPYSVVGGKWIRYVAIALPSLYLAGGWAMEKSWNWGRNRWGTRSWRPAMASIVLVLTVWPLVNTMQWMPYERLFLNPLGGGRANIGQLFPPDEVYDLGVREAVEYVCRVAPHGARLAGSDPMGIGFYTHLLGRKDIKVKELFNPQYKVRPGDYLLIADSRRYFETNSLINLIEKIRKPVATIRDDGLVTARVYRF